METPKEYYYTYYSYEEWGRGYFGSRGCKCLPEEDVKYFGSSKDKNFKPTQKIILKDDYATREEAYADEIILQQYYKVVENLHFANKAYQTTTKFYVPTEQAIEHGRKLHELGIGFHGLSKEEIVENAKKGGKCALELGLGIHAQTKEERIKNGKKGGHKNYELGLGIHARTKEEMIKHGKRVGKLSGEKRAIEFVLMDPHGNIHNGKNVNEFCEKRNLDPAHIHRVLKGIYSQCKGWTTPSIFLHEFDIDIYSLKMEERRILVEKLFKKISQRSTEKTAREFVLIDPEGNIHRGKNLKRFCERHKLHRASIIKVLNGKFKQHRGWTKPKNF
jgi:hypothetical protein